MRTYEDIEDELDRRLTEDEERECDVMFEAGASVSEMVQRLDLEEVEA